MCTIPIAYVIRPSTYNICDRASAHRYARNRVSKTCKMAELCFQLLCILVVFPYIFLVFITSSVLVIKRFHFCEVHFSQKTKRVCYGIYIYIYIYIYIDRYIYIYIYIYIIYISIIENTTKNYQHKRSILLELKQIITFKELMAPHFLDEKTAKDLISTKAKTSQFKMFPKIYEVGNPERPVASLNDCHTQ